MPGRITQILDDQQAGIIVGEDGAEYAFHSGALINTEFRWLRVGNTIEFTPIQGVVARHAAMVRYKS